MVVFLFFASFFDAKPNLGPGRLTVEISRSHIIRHIHTPGRTPLNE